MFDTIPSDEIIEKTAEALNANGIETFIVASQAEAKQKLFEIIPPNAQVMNNTSVTMDAIGATEEILNPEKYQPVRPKLMDKDTSPHDKLVLGATSDWTTGSVHAITQDGVLMIASGTGSQLPADANSSPNVVFVAGAQKIVKDRDEGFRRIYEHCWPLESERANKAYNITTGSFVSKILILNRERPGRLHLILVKEVLGF